jgi:hypothetical protein
MSQCMCKSRTGHPNVLDFKSGILMNANLYMVLPVTDKQ